MINEFPVGLLFSTSGSYGAVGKSLLNGAKLAIAEINSSPEAGVRLRPYEVDPGSDLKAYSPAAEAMIANGITQVVGCYTSSSRKEVIPVFEKRDALLWYPTHYEGFESSPNVIYTGAAPNHHILPLVNYFTSQVGRRVFCVGSNYIWAWESNRILREELSVRDGVVVSEHYVTVGECDFDRIIEAVFESEPDIIFNSLIGESAYAFFRDFRRACLARGIDQAKRYPVASCNLSEPELSCIGDEFMEGHLSSSVYFSSIDTDANRNFVRSYKSAYPDEEGPSAEAEAAYIATILLSKSLAEAGSDRMRAVKACAASKRMVAPQGEVFIDPENFHAHLTPRIGLSRRDRQFEVVFDAGSSVAPDPYLVNSSSTLEATQHRPHLRIV